jgi:hypothetical protein
MSGAVDRFRAIVVEGALRGPGTTTVAARQAAFDNQGVDERARRLVDKVARHAWKITDEDVTATKAAGMSEDAIFELSICAALGQSTRQLDAALAALDAAGSPGAAAVRTSPTPIHKR